MILFYLLAVKGLSPLPEPGDDRIGGDDEPKPDKLFKSKAKQPSQSLSFSSTGSGSKPAAKKRKVLSSGRDDGPDEKANSKPAKKPKKAQKKLLSFGDDT